MTFEFTNTWFPGVARQNWEYFIPQFNPKYILEIGSHEGQATCYLIEALSKKHPLEIHCIDPWQNYDELPDEDMSVIEGRFDKNILLAKSRALHNVTIIKRKEQSDIGLSRLLVEGKRNFFDFIYVDGSHKAPEVLLDAVVAFRLLKIGGLMVFDDYIWHEYDPSEIDLFRCPKPAIDAFVNLNWRKLKILSAHLYQFYIQKISD
jgi:predicted O-methyltransferase YrrM